jgi:hypothetical protein
MNTLIVGLAMFFFVAASPMTAASRQQRDISELDLALGAVGEILIVDPVGRKTGFDPVTMEIVEQIPNSAYFRDAVDNDVIGAPATEVDNSADIPQPIPGRYQVFVHGLKLGTYTLSASMFSQDGSQQPEVQATGIAGPGSTSVFAMQIDPTPGSNPTIAVVATFQSTLADIANSLSLGLIDNRETANSLTQKLEAAQKSGQPARTNQLVAFMVEVQMQAGKHISDLAAQVLRQDAQSLLNQ